MTSSLTIQGYPRTRSEALLDVGFGATYNELNSRIYRRAHNWLSFAQAVLGSAAFAFIWAKDVTLSGYAGLAIAVLVGLDVSFDLSGRAAKFEAHARRYKELLRAAPRLGDAELDDMLRALQAEVQDGEIKTLELPAYNRNLLAQGRPDAVVPTSRWQRSIAVLA